MKLAILIVNFCIFKLSIAAPGLIQSHHTAVDDDVIVKQGVGLKNERKLWQNVNGQVIVPWRPSIELSKTLKIKL